MKKTLLLFLFLIAIHNNAISEPFIVDQKILLQFEKMLYNNGEGSGFNYVSGSTRFLGDYRKSSDDSLFRIINNVDVAIGVVYNETDKGKIQEDKISGNSSVNHKLLGNLFANGTADLKSQFVFENAYVLGAIGASYIYENLSIQDNPITLRGVISKNDSPKLEYGNYFRLAGKGDLDTNISMTLRLENFYQYGKVGLKESYGNLQTITSFQISNIISSHLIVNLLLDPVQSKKLQAGEKLTIGITWKL